MSRRPGVACARGWRRWCTLSAIVTVPPPVGVGVGGNRGAVSRYTRAAAAWASGCGARAGRRRPGQAPGTSAVKFVEGRPRSSADPRAAMGLDGFGRPVRHSRRPRRSASAGRSADALARACAAAPRGRTRATARSRAARPPSWIPGAWWRVACSHARALRPRGPPPVPATTTATSAIAATTAIRTALPAAPGRRRFPPLRGRNAASVGCPPA